MKETKSTVLPLSRFAEARARRQLPEAAASLATLATLAASTGLSLEALAPAATPAPKTGGTAQPAASGLGGLDAGTAVGVAKGLFGVGCSASDPAAAGARREAWLRSWDPAGRWGPRWAIIDGCPSRSDGDRGL